MKTSQNQSHTDQDIELIYVSRNPPKAKTDRKERIQSLIEQIQLGGSFQSSELRAALGSVAWAEFRQKTQIAPLHTPAHIAGELRTYSEAVRRADAMARDGDVHQRHLSPKQRFKLGCVLRGVEVEYERVLELVERIAEDYKGVAVWFDRPLVFGPGSDLSPDAENIPRLLRSRSQYVIKTVPIKELERVALICLYDALKTCGQPKSTARPKPQPQHEVESDWFDAGIASDSSESDPFDLDGDLFRGLL